MREGDGQAQLALNLSGEPPRKEGVASEACAVVRELERVARSGLRRRTLVARTRGEGREFLGQLARRGCSWAGFDVRTPLTLAERIVEERGWPGAVERIDEFDEQRLLEQALDDVVGANAGQRYRELAEKVGFRRAVRSSVKELRLAGISGDGKAARTAGSAGSRFVVDVLRRFERLLEEGGLADEAWVLERAAKMLDVVGGAGDAARRRGRSAALPDCDETYLLPGHLDGGLRGDFLRALLRRGAALLPADPVVGLEAPRRRRPLWDVALAESQGSRLHACRDGERREDVEVFRAASICDELRGVLRRAVAWGACWDQVEIVTPDPMSYGSALHAIAESLGIPATFAAGLPVQRTRPGRVAAAYFRWIEGQFAESVFRGLVEAGDVRARGDAGGVLPRRLAEALRRLRIGYRRDRYRPALERAAADLGRMEQGKHESPEGLEKRKRRRSRELAALEDLVLPALDATPPTDGSPVSPAQVATGVRALLDRVAPGTDADKSARAELERRLGRIEAELRRPTDFGSAAATVQGFLQVPVAPPGADGPTAPWTSAPGRLHLSSLEHGGASGRPFTFVVGMDAANFPGTAFEDPLLSDRDRIRLDTERIRNRRLGLRLAGDDAQEKRFRFAELFAGLRGRVAVSYASWEPFQARELAPAAEVLQAHRLALGDSAVSFSRMSDGLATPESRVPGSGSAALLDRDDVWLHAISTADGRLRRATRAVARGYPKLADGMAAAAALGRPEPSVHAGFLGAGRPPFSFQDIAALGPLSASALQDLGACPRRFLLRTVLRAYPPDDPEFDPHRWLNARERGALLHRVYERTLWTARKRGIDPGREDFEALALEEVERQSRRALIETPSPSDAVRGWEVRALREDAKSFVTMIRDTRPAWLKLELEFGRADVLEVELGGRMVSVRGSIDRVDDAAGLSAEDRGGAGRPSERGESVRVVDYKTGSASYWSEASGAYDGGRRLQHVVYAAAARASLGRPMDRMEYRFPTRRGENDVRAYDADRLADGGRLVAAMLDGVEAGCFPATDNPAEDCRFCDYKAVCGVDRDVGAGELTCRAAAWTAERLEEGDGSAPAAVAALRKAREWESGAAFP